MIPNLNLHPAALPRPLTEPSGGEFLFAAFLGTMAIVGTLVFLVFRTVNDPNHRSPVLSDDGGDGDGDVTPPRD